MPIRRSKATDTERVETPLEGAVRCSMLELAAKFERLEQDDLERLGELLLRDDLDADETEELDARIENYKRDRRRTRRLDAGMAKFDTRWERKSSDPVWLTTQRERAVADHRPAYGPPPPACGPRAQARGHARH